jgi:hypothetical protein
MTTRLLMALLLCAGCESSGGERSHATAQAADSGVPTV